ncbi:MAG TPA: type II secretion system protein [Candidatus Rubrimentiphilum sp.]|nr:type II secretion system protein [Candidatus Rubrimentiphilum sp.]
MKSQAGFALLEVLAVIGIFAVCAGTLILAISGFAKFGSHAVGRNHAAALVFAEQTLRVAENAWKYGTPGAAPSGSAQVAIPVAVPSSAPTTIPVTVTSTLSNASSTGATIAVTVLYTPDPEHPGDSGIVTLNGTLNVKAPLPGAQVQRPGFVAQPQGGP